MKLFETPEGIFRANSKKEVVEYFSEKYPEVKQKQIVLIENSPQGVKIKSVLTLKKIEGDLKRAIQTAELLISKDIPESRRFKLGDRVEYGHNLGEWYVDNIYADGRVYLIVNSDGTSFRVLNWIETLPYREQDTGTHFRDEEALFISYGNFDINSLVTRLNSFGVDLSPEYQRDFVWNTEDKVLLIDSIFKDLDIGKFVFIKYGYRPNQPSYEILDGKQRLTAIKEFLEDRFSYRGHKYSELGIKDREFFMRKSVSFGDINKEYMKDADVIKYFLRLNQGGVAVDREHLEMLREKYKIQD